MLEPAIHFKAENWFRIKGRGWVAITTCDKERPRDNTGLLNQCVAIYEEPFLVKGVECHLPGYPIQKGEPIGLLVGEIGIES